MNPLTDPLRAAAQRLFDAALDSGFPPEEIDPESSYAQRVTLGGRDLDALRDALAARPGLDVEALGEAIREVYLAGHRDGTAWDVRAEAIAAEYARLTEERP